MVGLERLPLYNTCWVALLQEHTYMNQLDNLESVKVLLRPFALRQPWEAASIFNMSSGHITGPSPDPAPFCMHVSVASARPWRRRDEHLLRPVSLCY